MSLSFPRGDDKSSINGQRMIVVDSYRQYDYLLRFDFHWYLSIGTLVVFKSTSLLRLFLSIDTLRSVNENSRHFIPSLLSTFEFRTQNGNDEDFPRSPRKFLRSTSAISSNRGRPVVGENVERLIYPSWRGSVSLVSLRRKRDSIRRFLSLIARNPSCVLSLNLLKS